MEKNDNETTTSPPAASHPDQDVVRPVETKKDNTKASDETIYSPEQPESIHKNDDDDEEEEEEVYELVQVLSAAQVRRPRAVRCHTPDCSIKAAVVYATVNAPEQELWYSCLDCQEKDFGGWPDAHSAEMKRFKLTPEHEHILRTECASDPDIRMPSDGPLEEEDSGTPVENSAASPGQQAVVQPPKGSTQETKLPASTPSISIKSDAKSKDEPDGEPTWELIKVLDAKYIAGPAPISCYTPECFNNAAVVYVSSASPREKWYSCLDCQEADFMGWPDEEEMRAHIITPKLAKVLKKYCSKDPMVEVPITAGPPVKQTSAPVPNLTSPEATRGKNGASKSNETVSHLVTPVVTERDVSMPCSKVSDKKAMEMHKKWLKQAQAFDPNAKLILDMEKAKKLILDVLYDAFAPMNITQIHKALKAIVPSPVLKTCLDAMSSNSDSNKPMFADSDDDEENDKNFSKAKAAIGGTTTLLCRKINNNSASDLYYVDYHKTSNQGNGLPIAEKTELLTAIAKTDNQKQLLQLNIKKHREQTAKLLSEPTNEELECLLDEEQGDLEEWRDKIIQARTYQANAKRKDTLKRRIQSMCAEWRKRRRLCLDFLTNMEELSDGAVSRSTCLAGNDNNIDIESDQVAAELALAYAANAGKKTIHKRPKLFNDAVDRISPNPKFVAVRLNSQGCVERVFTE